METQKEGANSDIVRENKVQLQDRRGDSAVQGDVGEHQETERSPSSANSSSCQRTPDGTYSSISISPFRRRFNLDLFQALEISYLLLIQILHPNYLKKILGKMGELSRFQDLEENRIRILNEISVASKMSRGTWNNRELPESLFGALSLKVQLSAVLEKLVSILERRVDDQYLKRSLPYSDFFLYKEAERVRRDALSSSSFILKRGNESVEENYGGCILKKGKFELTPVDRNFGNGRASNRSRIEEACTPPKRRLTFEDN